MPVKGVPTRMIWRDTGATAYRYVPTKLIITKNKARQSWEFTRTDETTLSIMDDVGGNGKPLRHLSFANPDAEADGVAAEIARWARVVKTAGIKPE